MTLIALGGDTDCCSISISNPPWSHSNHASDLAIGLIASIYRPTEATFLFSFTLLLGAIGLPVFSGGHGGISAFCPTGFLFFFPLRALVTSIFAAKRDKPIRIFLANALGKSFSLLGALGFMLITHQSLDLTVKLVVLPFVLPDLIKMTLTTIFAVILYRNLKHLPYFKKKIKLLERPANPDSSLGAFLYFVARRAVSTVAFSRSMRSIRAAILDSHLDITANRHISNWGSKKALYSF